MSRDKAQGEVLLQISYTFHLQGTAWVVQYRRPRPCTGWAVAVAPRAGGQGWRWQLQVGFVPSQNHAGLCLRTAQRHLQGQPLAWHMRGTMFEGGEGFTYKAGGKSGKAA